MAGNSFHGDSSSESLEAAKSQGRESWVPMGASVVGLTTPPFGEDGTIVVLRLFMRN